MLVVVLVVGVVRVLSVESMVELVLVDVEDVFAQAASVMVQELSV